MIIVKDCLNILKEKEWFLIKEQRKILETLLENEFDINNLNQKIIEINNLKTNFIKFGKLSVIIKDNNSYKLFLTFIKEIKKYDIYQKIEKYHIEEEKLYY